MPPAIRRTLAFLGLVFLILTPPLSGAAPIRFGWDASDDPTILGYVVFVGVKPGQYTEAYDVGRQNTFSYSPVADGKRYYFAVSGYAAGVMGPRSEEISWVGGEPLPIGTPSEPPPMPPPTPPAPSFPVWPDVPDPFADSYSTADCTVPSAPASCFVSTEVAAGLGRVTSMTVAADGRLWFIEDGRHVRVIERDTLLGFSPLSADASSALTGLAVDPAFEASRAVFVGRADRSSSGDWDLTVVRYRELRNVLGEGASVITGLPMPASSESPIVLDQTRHVYIAMPAFSPPRADSRAAYSGFVIRLNVDGTMPSDARSGSPVLAYGYALPTSMTWSPTGGGELWLSGSNASLTSGLARVSSRVAVGPDWPAVPAAVAAASAPWPHGIRPSFGNIESLAGGLEGDVYVALRGEGSAAQSAASTILHLRPR